MRGALQRWVFESFPLGREGLAAFRIAYALYVMWVIAPGHNPYASFSWLGDLPNGLFLPPPGPMMAFTGFPPSLAADAVELGLYLALTAVLLGWRTRWATLLTGALLVVGYGFSFSLGKINHYVLFILLPFVMSASGWGAAWSLDARSGRTTRAETWPVTLLALLVGFGMFTAGLAKLMGGWLDPATQASYGHLVRQFVVRDRQDLLAPLLVGLDGPILWETLDWATVAFELGFLPAVMRPATTRLFAGLAVLFHLGTTLSLNISYAVHLPVYAAFLPWERAREVASPMARRVARAVRAARTGHLATAALVVALLLYAFGSPLLLLQDAASFRSDLVVSEVLAVLVAAVAVLGLGVQAARERLRRPAAAPVRSEAGGP